MANDQRICSIDGCNKPHYAHGWCTTHYMRWLRHGDPLGGGTSRGEPLRFIHEVALAYEGDECLEWPFSRGGDGYGRMKFEAKAHTPSRVVCKLAHGDPPTPEHEAAHSCGNGHLGCITKRHLSWKTPVENHADMLAHGTLLRGERHPQAKLSAGDVEHIRSLRGKLIQRDIAIKFGISRPQVSKIQAGRRRAV